MTESDLTFAEQETQRLNTEVEALQGEISFHIETRDAWERILCDPGFKTHAVCLDLAAAEKVRLNEEIETVGEKIRRHIETIEGWNVVKQRTENALLSLEKERLNGHVEAVQEMAVQERMDSPIETQSALDATPRYAENETRVYQGATYAMGADRQWHLQRTDSTSSRDEVVETARGWWRAAEAETAAESVWQSFRGACERILGRTENDADLPVPDKGQFLSLGLN